MLKNIAIIFLTILVFLMYFRPITAISQDIGRHILTGQIILETTSIPSTNLYSYTYPNYPFINHHWFSEIIFYIVQKLFGFFGLLLLTSLIAAGAFLLQLLYVRKSASLIAIMIATLLYLRVLLERTDLRPEIFSFFFLSVFIVILYKNREKFTKWIYVLPFLELIWVNTHIYFPIGILVLSLFLIDHLVKKIKRGVAGAGDPHRVPAANARTSDGGKARQDPAVNRNLFFVFFACCFVIFINPNFIQGALYPIHVFDNYGYTIEENQNVFFLWNLFQKQTLLYFFSCVTLLFFSLIVTFKKARSIDWLLAIIFSVLGALSERNLPLFVFATLIPFIYSFTMIDTFITKRIEKNTVAKWSLVLVFSLFIIFQTKDIVTFRPIGYQLPNGAKNGVDFMIQNNISGPLFNNFDIGSYLEYRLYPQEKVFVDGRPEAYPTDFFQKIYIPMQQNPALFKKISDTYRFNTIFFSHTDQTPWAQEFLATISKNPDWRLVYLDDTSIIFVKNSLFQNTPTVSEKTVKIPNAQEEGLAQFALLLQKLGWTEKEITVHQKILQHNPTYCFSLYYVSTILSERKDPAASIYIQRFNNSCS